MSASVEPPWSDHAIVVRRVAAADPEQVFAGTLLDAVKWLRAYCLRDSLYSVHLPDRVRRPFSFHGADLAALLKTRPAEADQESFELSEQA